MEACPACIHSNGMAALLSSYGSTYVYDTRMHLCLDNLNVIISALVQIRQLDGARCGAAG